MAIANIRDANPQRGYSYVGSEATSKVNKRDEKGEFQICEDDDVAQDLEDVKVSTCPHDGAQQKSTSQYSSPGVIVR